MRRALVVLALAAACSVTSNGGSSGGTTTTRRADAGPGRSDGGSRDAGPSGAVDSGPADAGLADAGPGDAGPTDAGEPDDAGPAEVCPADAYQYKGEVLDLCQSLGIGTYVPLDGVQIATIPAYSSTVSSDGGLFVACLPPGVPATLRFSLDGYVTTYFAEVAATATPIPGGNLLLSMSCNSGVQAYTSQLPAFDPSLATVFIGVHAVTPGAPCDSPDAGFAGWSFTAGPVDGGVGDGGPWPSGYFDSSGTLQATSATFADGRAMVFDIDPGAEYVTVQGANSAAASSCPTLDGALGLTGRVYVAAGAFSFEPWILP